MQCAEGISNSVSGAIGHDSAIYCGECQVAVAAGILAIRKNPGASGRIEPVFSIWIDRAFHLAYCARRIPANSFQENYAMRYLLVFVFLTFCPLLQAQDKIPKFRDYPVIEAYIGQTAPLVLTKADRLYRTRLRELAQEKPNFAGRYILGFWGCGTTCLMGAAIDAKTGQVSWLPGTVCCWGFDRDENFNPLEFRLNSRLIVLSGMINENEPNGAHFYKFENGQFIHIRTISKNDSPDSKKP